MHRQQDLSRHEVAAEGGPSRRTLVRATAGVAWTAPLVAAAVPAPAFAASMPMGQVTIVEAKYFWRYYEKRDKLWGFTPLVTVRNDGPQTTRIEVSLRFASSFEGSMADGRATMYFQPKDWGSQSYGPTPDSLLSVNYRRRSDVPPVDTGGTVTLGDWTQADQAHCLMFKSTATGTVSLTVTAPGFGVTAGVVTQVEQPA